MKVQPMKAKAMKAKAMKAKHGVLQAGRGLKCEGCPSDILPAEKQGNTRCYPMLGTFAGYSLMSWVKI